VCKEGEGDYCWGVSTAQEMLICASLHNLTSLRLIADEGTRWVSIRGQTTISSLATIAPPKKRGYRFAERMSE
jgi:hypothetical protein